GGGVVCGDARRPDPGRRVPDHRRRHDPRRRARADRVLWNRYHREVTVLARRDGEGDVGARLASHTGPPGPPADAPPAPYCRLADAPRGDADGGALLP